MKQDPDELEVFVGRLLGEQPLRRAPPALQARVMASLQAARPWWRKSFAHWPLTARVGFLVSSCGFVKLALAGAGILSAAVSMTDFVTRAIPPYWLYGAAAVVIALYMTLFGLGTVAYRALYLDK